MRMSVMCTVALVLRRPFCCLPRYRTPFSAGCPLGTKQVGVREVDTGNVIVVHPQCEELNVAELDNQLDQLGNRNRHDTCLSRPACDAWREASSGHRRMD